MAHAQITNQAMQDNHTVTNFVEEVSHKGYGEDVIGCKMTKSLQRFALSCRKSVFCKNMAILDPRPHILAPHQQPTSQSSRWKSMVDLELKNDVRRLPNGKT